MEQPDVKRVELEWVGGMGFLARNAGGRSIPVGTVPDGLAVSGPGGQGLAPMELVLAALGGCTGMDVVSILEKMREPLQGLTISVEGTRAAEHPKPYTAIRLTYRLRGGVDAAKARRAAELSIERYCSVGAMITGVVPVSYKLVLEGSEEIDLGTKGGR